MHPAPDILHGSYLISEQSPASSHNTPVLSHTRSFNIPIYRPYVKKKFSISAKIFGIFFVQVYEINFGGNRGVKGRKTQDLRDGTEAVPYGVGGGVRSGMFESARSPEFFRRGRPLCRPVCIICGVFFLFSPALVATLATPSALRATSPKRGSASRQRFRGG